MIGAILTLLLFQLAGEAISRAFGLPIPGPVIGMALFFAALLARPALADRVAPVTATLLGHLSLLFVPAGVGIVGHLDLLARDGLAIGAALAGSTVLAILAGVGTFRAIARITEGRE